MEVIPQQIGISCLGPCRLSLVASHLRTPILNCFSYVLWAYFLTDSEFSCLAMLAKPLFTISCVWPNLLAPDS